MSTQALNTKSRTNTYTYTYVLHKTLKHHICSKDWRKAYGVVGSHSQSVDEHFWDAAKNKRK